MLAENLLPAPGSAAAAAAAAAAEGGGQQQHGRDLAWYLELREFGTVPHAGWGLGFERLVQLLTGVRNVRDVCAVPRYPGFCRF